MLAGMDARDILHRRINTQRLAGDPFARPEDMVRSLVGVQSQDYGNARWSVGQRTANCTDADVARAFDEGRILRTHVLRPTWHFVTPEDIRWLLTLTAPRVHALNAYSYRQLDLDDAIFARCETLITDTLQGGNQLTRPGLAALLADAGIVANALRLSYIMMHAELDGLICSGAMRGKQHTYALLEERASQATTWTHEESLAELALRFFSGHGPVSLRDYVRWSGLTVADARAGLEMVKAELTEVELDGTTLWYRESAIPPLPTEKVAYLLPEYDECVLTYRDVGFPDRSRGGAVDPSATVFDRPVIVDRQRAGTWRRMVGSKAVTVDVTLFTSLTAVETTALDAALARYSAFIQLPVTVTLL